MPTDVSTGQGREAKAAKKTAAKAQIYNLNFQPKFITQTYIPNLQVKEGGSNLAQAT